MGLVLTMWLRPEPLVLASRSAIRRTVLEAAGIPVEVSPADLDERATEARAGSSYPGEIAALLARPERFELPTQIRSLVLSPVT